MMKFKEVATMVVLLAAVSAGEGTVWGAETKSSGTSATSIEKKIDEVKTRLKSEPKNRKGWVALGNLYFDSGRQKEAVDAYAKALELKGDDPDVLCDQGIMYGQMGEPVKAVENFEKALAVDPKHRQSLYNAGRISNEQLHQPTRALYYWRKLVAVDPKNPAVQPIKSFVERFEKDIAELNGSGGQPAAK